jgi:hypothetical protein
MTMGSTKREKEVLADQGLDADEGEDRIALEAPVDTLDALCDKRLS